ncbi:MAG: DUF2161 family putative PD-(D/E)XK-type phosphodiesterase [bacterium]
MRRKPTKNTRRKISERDLSQPVTRYLIEQGYTVRSEVMDCDITAAKGENLVVIELKRSLNTSLLIQATQRQRITDSVYVALPCPEEGIWTKKWRSIQHLLKRLELGLILVNTGSGMPSVEIVFHPVPFDRKKQKRKKRAILQEMSERSGDYNRGGSVRRKIFTAYREKAIHIACCLEKYGPLSPRQLRELGTDSKTQSILYDNHYGWFERVDRGVYALKPRAMEEIKKYSDLVSHYRNKIHNSINR